MEEDETEVLDEDVEVDVGRVLDLLAAQRH
jgi:hypothetical protein